MNREADQDAKRNLIRVWRKYFQNSSGRAHRCDSPRLWCWAWSLLNVLFCAQTFVWRRFLHCVVVFQRLHPRPRRYCSHWAVPSRQPVAEGLHRARGPPPVPGPGGRSSDHAALLSAGRNRTSERTLLLLLCPAGSMRPGPTRRPGPKTVGCQREALWTLLRWNDYKGLFLYFK